MSLRSIYSVLILISTAALGACAGYAPSKHFVGMSRSETISILGDPAPIPADIASSQRLDFPRGPYGKHTYSVYFDEQGRATGYRQLLTEDNFAKIVPGIGENDVIQLIGVSKSTFRLARERGYVWNYRYENPLCRWFQIEFTLEGTVRSAGYSKPPECRVGGRLPRF